MIRKSLVVALAITAAVPAAAAAKPSGTDQRNAAKECKAERGTTDASRQAFAEKYGTNANDRNAFGKCVSQKAREEQSERKKAKTNASKECKAEREQLGKDAFAQKYGTNKNKRNAFGKCVSGKAKKAKAELDEQDQQQIQKVKKQNAAKQCDAERGTTDASREAFAQKYGTGKNRSNAFGKCVSKLARS